MKARHKAFSEQEHCSIVIPCGQKYGNTPEYELAYLAHVAYSCGSAYAHDNVIVEIGSLVGKSTISMASASRHRIVSIDPHDGPWEMAISDGNTVVDNRDIKGSSLRQFTENLEYYGVADKVEIIKKYSDVAARDWDGRRICLLFIDGDHTEEWVRHDLDAFYPHMAVGGLIAFHDYSKSFSGVTKVVDEAVESGRLRVERQVGQLIMTQCNNFP